MAKAVRLDKFLADAGKGTRSEVKKFIQKGQVQVNGLTARKPELKVDPEKDVGNPCRRNDHRSTGVCILSSEQTGRLCQCY